MIVCRPAAVCAPVTNHDTSPVVHPALWSRKEGTNPAGPLYPHPPKLYSFLRSLVPSSRREGFLGLSVADTIRQCLRLGLKDAAAKLAREFKASGVAHYLGCSCSSEALLGCVLPRLQLQLGSCVGRMQWGWGWGSAAAVVCCSQALA